MNLLVVSTWWPCPADNGSRMRAWQLLRQMVRRHRVTLLAFGRAGGAEARAPLEALGIDARRVPAPAGADAGLTAAGLLSRVPRHFVQRDSPAMRALIGAALPAHDAAVGLQIEAARYLAERPWIPRLFEEVEVTVPRERAARGPAAARARHGLTWLKHRAYVRGLVDRMDGATVVSTAERDALAAIGCDPGRIRVVANGVEAGPDGPAPVRVERAIYPGSVQYSANLDAVRAFVRDVLPLVRRARPGFSFWVTGETAGVDLGGLRGPGVVFTGCVPSVDALIRESAVCAVPLRVGGGTRLKVLQAMALGTPVVSTAKGIEGLEVAADRHVAVADTAAAMAGWILRALDEPGEAAAMADRARALVRARYGWEPAGDALERAIQEACARHAAGPACAARRVRAV